MYPQFFQWFRKFLFRFTNTHGLLWMTLAALLVLADCSTASTPANTLVAPTGPAAINTLSATNAASPATAANSAPVGADWPTYHRDNARTGYLPDMPDPQQLTVAWNTPLD